MSFRCGSAAVQCGMVMMSRSTEILRLSAVFDWDSHSRCSSFPFMYTQMGADIEALGHWLKLCYVHATSQLNLHDDARRWCASISDSLTRNSNGCMQRCNRTWCWCSVHCMKSGSKYSLTGPQVSLVWNWLWPIHVCNQMGAYCCAVGHGLDALLWRGRRNIHEWYPGLQHIQKDLEILSRAGKYAYWKVGWMVCMCLCEEKRCSDCILLGRMRVHVQMHVSVCPSIHTISLNSFYSKDSEIEWLAGTESPCRREEFEV